jgi:hypothetical protein
LFKSIQRCADRLIFSGLRANFFLAALYFLPIRQSCTNRLLNILFKKIFCFRRQKIKNPGKEKPFDIVLRIVNFKGEKNQNAFLFLLAIFAKMCDNMVLLDVWILHPHAFLMEFSRC